MLRLLSSGATNLAIGTQFHITAGTVKKHLDRIYRKLGVRSRTELAHQQAEHASIKKMVESRRIFRALFGL